MIGELNVVKAVGSYFKRPEPAKSAIKLARDVYKRAPWVNLEPVLGPEAVENAHFKQVLSQWTPLGRRQADEYLRGALTTGKYTPNDRWDAACTLAQLVPQRIYGTGGGSSPVLGDDAIALAEKLVAQAGAVIGGSGYFDDALKTLYGGLGDALRNKDRAAFGRYMRALRPDMPAKSVDNFYGQGAGWGGLVQALLGGDQALRMRLTAIGTFEPRAMR